MGRDSGENEEEVGERNQDWNQQEANKPRGISNGNNENVELGWVK